MRGGQMIVSVHIADLGVRGTLSVLRRPPDPEATPGLHYAETTITAAIGGSPLPLPRPRRVAMIAAWEGDGALEAFARDHPLGRRLAGGWHVRLRPLRVSGAWPEMPGLPEQELPVADEEPVAVLTLGRLRLARVVPFLRASAPAESEVAKEAELLAATGLARPPHLVSTFSLWRSAAAMRDYAYREHGAHRAAVRSDRERAFHHRSAFVRFRPYASQGSWDGRDPLAGLA
ncbi:MAG: spheroidene monooxygenase [Solirubrobacterales bacterium]